MPEKTYIAIDLKSFFASVECVERGLDPLTTNLVVADASRTEKTICLAVTPALKSYGIPGRPRLFEVIQRVREVNCERKRRAPGQAFTGVSCNFEELSANPQLELAYMVAPPRMAYYMSYSTKIYNIYLKYVAPEDIHVYSIDEVFMDVTSYLDLYQMNARELAMTMIRDVLETTGITATAGIGTNLYLCKIAMDIVAKKIPADENGVRIAELDEITYRRLLWNHTPITDFWRVGKGYEKKLSSVGLHTMGDVARCSLGKENEYYNEDLLYDLFGINAELLIDHAWGWEPTTIPEIKAYTPENSSLGSGQVLKHPYSAEKAKLITKEMAELLALELVDKKLVTDQMVLTVGYDVESLKDPAIKSRYHGEITTDHYGRRVPKHAHGTVNLSRQTSSSRQIREAVEGLFDRIVNQELLVRRINICANHVVREDEIKEEDTYEQLDLFTDYAGREEQRRQANLEMEKEHRLQQAVVNLQKKYGKNAVLKGMNLEEDAMTRERNQQIGGHKA